MRLTPRYLLLLSIVGAPLVSLAQQAPLTLDQALNLARERNGTVKAAYYDANAANARVGQSLAAFFPSVVPTYQYVSERRQFDSSTGKFFTQSEGGTTVVSASWRILDSGEREFGLLSSRRSEDSAQANALQTLRGTLFDVYTQFLGTLQAQELLKVDAAQVQRTSTILDQTKARVQAGDVAAKEVLQSQADALNAQVAYLASKNRLTNAQASLKSVIGWDSGKALPDLSPMSEPTALSLAPLESLMDKAIADRQDLLSERRQLESLHFSQLLADRKAGPTFAADLNFDKVLTPTSLEDRSLTLSVNGPFFDGGFARSQARAAKFAYLAAKARYDQDERQARADIEAAYKAAQQNEETIVAAKAAREAAQANYQAAVESQKVGASNLIDVLTAQVSLITAESNYVQALYDTILSYAKLDLELGHAMPGEKA